MLSWPYHGTPSDTRIAAHVDPQVAEVARTADSPFTHTTRPHGGPAYLPAGDPWIVYPGADGPLDSIRFEAMREGLADHALLEVVGKSDPAAANQLAAELVLDFDRYQTGVPASRAVRRQLLDRASLTAP
jgi:hypothetical protein